MDTSICPKFEKASSLLSKKWSSLIIYQLLNGPKRFSDLQKEIKVSAKMLSERLKELEEEEIIKRHVYPETPIRIEYCLTAKGKSFEPILAALSAWSQEWIK
ncbi:MAG: winged helix-turn-helix transcriptional regulator [Bacilli bacterium]|nr:winged helix-turn-helix transcriptional regulator [Bacilli bacterium]